MNTAAPDFKDRVSGFATRHQNTIIWTVFGGIVVTMIMTVTPIVLWLTLAISSATDVASFSNTISTDPKTYASIKPISEIEFGTNLYAYKRNSYIAVLDSSAIPPRLADSNGRLPVLKFNGDTFIIFAKYRNASAGIAISDDPDFMSKIESRSDGISIQKLRDNLYQWNLNL